MRTLTIWLLRTAVLVAPGDMADRIIGVLRDGRDLGAATRELNERDRRRKEARDAKSS